MSKQWGHGHATGVKETEQKIKAVAAAAVVAGVAIGVGAKWLYDKATKK